MNCIQISGLLWWMRNVATYGDMQICAQLRSVWNRNKQKKHETNKCDKKQIHNSEILRRVKKRILIAQMFNSRDRFDVNTQCSPKTRSYGQSCQLKHMHVLTKVHDNNGSMAIVPLPPRRECCREIKRENKIHMTGHRNFLCACLCVADITCNQGTKMAFPCCHFFYFVAHSAANKVCLVLLWCHYKFGQ